MNLLRLAFAAALSFAAAFAHAETVNGSGNAATDTRAVSGFRSVSLAVPGRLEIVQGDTEKLTLSGDDNILPYIETVVRGDELRIRFRERNNFNVRPRAPLRLALSAKVIEGISVAGSGDVRAPAINGRKMSLSIAGSGDITLGGKTQDLEVNIAGSGD